MYYRVILIRGGPWGLRLRRIRRGAGIVARAHFTESYIVNQSVNYHSDTQIYGNPLPERPFPVSLRIVIHITIIIQQDFPLVKELAVILT